MDLETVGRILLFPLKITFIAVCFVLGIALKIVLFAVQTCANLFALPFYIIGSLTSLCGLFMFVMTLRGGSAEFKSTGEFIFNVVIYFAIICIGGLITSLPQIADDLDVVPEFLFDRVGDVIDNIELGI